MARVRHALPKLESLQLGYNRLEGASQGICIPLSVSHCMKGGVLRAWVCNHVWTLDAQYRD